MYEVSREEEEYQTQMKRVSNIVTVFTLLGNNNNILRKKQVYEVELFLELLFRTRFVV